MEPEPHRTERRLRGIPPEYYPDDLEPVPTLPELAKMGLASVLERTTKGDPTVFRVHPDGQALIYKIMASNAEKKRRHDARLRASRRPDDR